MHYYGTRLSENISKREPEGYLLCLNVPVARTGTQEYLPHELGLPPGPGLVPVLRPEEEVFAPATVASFEGMPVTDGHPPEGVDATNIRFLQKGHAHNVRRGSGPESDLLLADLIITDPALIAAILEEGRREISCGYTYELCREDGQYVQRQIRGNHVAVVDAGRAGPRVCIKDHKPIIERRKTTMKRSLSKVLARMAKDGDIETVAGIIEEMLDPETPDETPAVPEMAEAPEEQPAEEKETKNIIIDEDVLGGVLERLDRIIGLLAPAAADETPEEAEPVAEKLEEAAEEAADPATEEIAAAMEEILDPVSSVILEAEEEAEGSALPEVLETGDALRAALAAVRPALASMTPAARRRAAGDIAARIRHGAGRRTADSDVYAALASAHRRTEPAGPDLGRRIMAKRNSNFKEDGHRG